METVNCIRCDYRHKDNGNCTAVGGFCTAVAAAHCPMLREYLDTGLTPAEVSAPVVRCAACRHRTEPACSKADDTARGIAKCGNTKSPCYGRLVYLTEFCSHGEREEDV